jgi:multidrug efflux pump subunit AcrA (membrane-fusion protein)
MTELDVDTNRSLQTQCKTLHSSIGEQHNEFFLFDGFRSLMTKQIVIVVAVVGLLIGLITYSQFRPTHRRVSGFIEADEIRVGSRLGGRVFSVQVQEGERVKAGQALVELEPFDLLEREQEATMLLAAREAEFSG